MVIEVLIDDDAFNVPEAEKISKTIIVNIPQGFSIKVMLQKLAERYPELVEPVVTLSHYYEENGKRIEQKNSMKMCI